MPDDHEKSLAEQAIDALNDLVEEAALTAVDAAPDPERIAPVTGEPVLIPEATQRASPAGSKADSGGGEQA